MYKWRIIVEDKMHFYAHLLVVKHVLLGLLFDNSEPGHDGAK